MPSSLIHTHSHSHALYFTFTTLCGPFPLALRVTAAMTPCPVWLDCDPGHDDALALILVAHSARVHLLGRGLHSFASQLNLSDVYGIGGARRGCVASVKGVFRVCRVLLCIRHGSS